MGRSNFGDFIQNRMTINSFCINQATPWIERIKRGNRTKWRNFYQPSRIRHRLAQHESRQRNSFHERSVDGFPYNMRETGGGDEIRSEVIRRGEADGSRAFIGPGWAWIEGTLWSREIHQTRRPPVLFAIATYGGVARTQHQKPRGSGDLRLTLPGLRKESARGTRLAEGGKAENKI